MQPESNQLNTYYQELTDGAEVLPERLYLKIGSCGILLRSNSAPLLNSLKHYFGYLVEVPSSDVDIEVVAIQRSPVNLPLEYADWKREQGKQGRKDSYYDFDGGRIVRKVRTGMVFLQSETHKVAAGDCLANDNQVINFVNAQYMTWLQRQDSLICHAAAVECNGKALAIAAFSGGGKSTTMLRLMDNDQYNFLTNDRLFIQSNPRLSTVSAFGVPKLPRINPGTIITNPKLESIIPEQRRNALHALPDDELWNLEEKYDVFIDDCYGTNRIQHFGQLSAFVILNWTRGVSQPMSVSKVDLNERRDLLAAIMKSPGPFYQLANGTFFQFDTPLNEEKYIRTFANLDVYEVSGSVDFDALVDCCQRELFQ